MSKINSFIENHPQFGWIASILSTGLGILQWLMDHADDFTKLIGLATALVGFSVGYYTLRIQHRTWKRTQAEDRK